MTTKAEVMEQAALDLERLLALLRRNPSLKPVCEELETMDLRDRDAVLVVALTNLARADAQIEASAEIVQAATAVLRRGG